MRDFSVYGLNLPKPNVRFLMFLSCVLSFVPGMYKESIAAVSLNFTLLFAAIASLVTANLVQAHTLVLKYTRIVDMFKTFQALHDKDDDNEVQSYRKLSMMLINCYQISFAFALASLVVMKFFGYSTCKLILPAMYDFLPDDFGILLAIHIPHVAFAMMLHITFELVHVVCLIRAEANLKLLGAKL